MQRRTFLTLGAVPYHLLAAPKKAATDIVTLGPRKIKLSRLAMGTGTNGAGGSSNQTKKLGVEGLAGMLRAAVDHGVNFWDSADQYGTHAHLKAALGGVAREKVVILSKTHASSVKEMRADIDRFRRELGTDYIDILLLHCMMDANWPERKKGAMEYISQLQEKGVVRTKGVSCHTLDALKTSARTPWVEVQLARINPAGAAMDAPPDQVIPVLKEMKAAGKGVIGMKIFGAGQLRNRRDECLRFVLSQDAVDCFTIGSESIAEMKDNIQRIGA